MNLSGRRAVVTGASSGIGRAVARAFAKAGADVIVHYNANRSGALACVADIRSFGGSAHAVGGDVTDSVAVAGLVDEVKSLLGGIDVWANIAGADILTGQGAALPDHDKLARLIDVDLRGTIHCCWAVAPEISDGGSIINTSWDLALRGMEGRNPEMFAAVKAGITGFTRCLARSLAPRVRVNDIAPGWIETEFAESTMASDYRDGVIAVTPMARFGKPEDIAAAAVYLASDAAAFVTGQTLKVNGGLSS